MYKCIHKYIQKVVYLFEGGLKIQTRLAKITLI